MARSYLPQALPALLSFCLNFSTLLTASPTLYGVTAADASAVASAVDDFDSALTASTDPSTRTPVTVAFTVTARNTVVQVVRNYGRLILANAGVADADKTALGLIIRDPVKTPVPVPSTNPLLTVVGATPGQLTMRYNDSAASPTVKAKPFGATQLVLYTLFGTTAPATPDATPFQGIYTKSPFALDTTAGVAGQNAFIYGRWMNAKGEMGPWSPLATSRII